jgi:hypothetical protein
MRRVFAVVAVLFSLLAIAGAAAFVGWYLYQPTYTISGTVTRDGKPLVWKTENGRLDVKFVPLDRERDRNVYRALQTDAKSGTYKIEGIPPGSYRVSIQQQDPDSRYDLLNFALGTDKSPILRDVSKDDDAFDIDFTSEMLNKGR